MGKHRAGLVGKDWKQETEMRGHLSHLSYRLPQTTYTHM